MSEERQSAAWTATGGYKVYPPYVSLTGNKLIVRGHETLKGEGYAPGARVEVELPEGAFEELIAARASVPLDTIMLGRFVAQYDEGADGFFVDADEAQEVARQVNAALTIHDELCKMLKRCINNLEGEPVGSSGHDFAREIRELLSKARGSHD